LLTLYTSLPQVEELHQSPPVVVLRLRWQKC
jgi:hypothetical protein